MRFLLFWGNAFDSVVIPDIRLNSQLFFDIMNSAYPIKEAIHVKKTIVHLGFCIAAGHLGTWPFAGDGADEFNHTRLFEAATNHG